MVYSLPDGFRPMKGETAEEGDVRFPCYASKKIDGFRCIVAPGGIALSAALKPIPNKHVQAYFKRHSNILTGLDGELCVGDPTDPDVFKKTEKALNSVEGEPQFAFYVFDRADCAEGFSFRLGTILPYQEYLTLSDYDDFLQEWDFLPARVHEHYHIADAEELADFVREALDEGYEGVMVRSPDGPYKYGRSTKREGYLLKLKPYRDDEAEIIELIEGQKNLNEKTKDARGLSQRSSHKANKIPSGTLGAFRVRVLTGPFKGVECKVATGSLTKEERKAIWDAQDKSKVITFKHMLQAGSYEKPRHAGFLRFRPDFDMPDHA